MIDAKILVAPALGIAIAGSVLAQAPVNPVLTYHYDNARSGANTNETVLSPANVNVQTFGRLFSYTVDGLVYAEPLYVPGLAIPGQGTHNVVFVATEFDSVFAFDADSNGGANGGLLWQTNLGQAASSASGDFGTRYDPGGYLDIRPVVGITGTPVIDTNSQTLYVDVLTHENSGYVHRIHALNITDGTERPFSPREVSASFPGIGVGTNGNGMVVFDAQQQLQRPALTLAAGVLYVAYGSYGDTDPYHGWVIGFDAGTLEPLANYVFNTTPNATTNDFGTNAGEGAIWMGGDGLAVDANTNLYFMVGNGSFDTNHGDYGDSFVKLSTTNQLAVADYFTPWNQDYLSTNDYDVGSSGPLLLPDSAGSADHRHLMVGAGKVGTIYLIDRDNMGRFNPASDSQIVQELPGAINGVWTPPAYYNNLLYYHGSQDFLKAFAITNGALSTNPVTQSTTTNSVPNLTSAPVISADGTGNAIVWEINADAAGEGGGPAVLRAYNATNLSQELYNSSQNLARDNPGTAVKFSTPTVINGKVYVGAAYELSVYGNGQFLAPPVITPGGGTFTNTITVTLSDTNAGASIYYTLNGTTPTTNSPLYSSPLVLSNSLWLNAITAEPGYVNSIVTFAQFTDNPAVSVTVQANPPNCSFLVDGVSYLATQVFEWPTGSIHAIAVNSPQGSAPDIRYVWTGWSDGGPISHVVTPSVDTTYVANFVTQYRLTNFNAASYAGLFYDTNGVSPGSAGLFTATTTRNNSFSGNLHFPGATHPFSGKFDQNGVATVSIARRGSAPISMQLQIDVFTRDIITGQVGDGASWGSALTANRAAYSRNIPAPEFGSSYTLGIAGGASPGQPNGNGFGAAKVGIAGGLSFSGVLGDGTPVAQTTFVAGNGRWPLYVPLYAGKGMILGWITFSNPPRGEIGGLVNWIRPSMPKSKFYPGGFTNQSAVIGSEYIYARGFRALGITSGALVLKNGAQSVTNQLTLGTNNVLTGPNDLILKIAPASGWFSGHLLDPATDRLISVRGTVLQLQDTGAGYFLENGQIGGVWLGAQ